MLKNENIHFERCFTLGSGSKQEREISGNWYMAEEDETLLSIGKSSS